LTIILDGNMIMSWLRATHSTSAAKSKDPDPGDLALT